MCTMCERKCECWWFVKHIYSSWRNEQLQTTVEEVIPDHRVRLEEGVAHGSSSLSDSGGWSQTTEI